MEIFSKKGLGHLFETIAQKPALTDTYSENAQRIIALADEYCHLIDAVVLFLQGKNPSMAHLICQEDYLPQASRFKQLDELDWAFGTMGSQDKAKYLATLFLEDLSDLIVECVDPHFGFSRYAERLGRSANSFDELYDTLCQPPSYVDEITVTLLQQKLLAYQPDLVCFTVPFPGNLYAALRCGQFIKQQQPQIKIAMGGGFANTELRSLTEPRVFEFFDFISLDDGEAPLEEIIKSVDLQPQPLENLCLKRTYVLRNGQVLYLNNSKLRDYPQAQLGTPDYGDLPLDRYISVIEIANPMHRLWSDGRWNKLTMAHGCYWAKCTFCDISLDYIKNYEPIAAKTLVDRMETLIAQTGQSGFHFVDEAAPPALMRDLAIEILRRDLKLSWWTNIRFEKSFTRDLCQLLKASGCIAVSGGLEVASDRLLELIQKGVTVAQVAQVAQHFTEAGIMVHAYLMYGFPTQTAQETVDSLEMVRQMFELGVLQSAYWHQFAMTAHAPVGLYPDQFGVNTLNTAVGSFANNDLEYTDPKAAPPELFSFGLKKSLYNYMHGLGFETPAHQWFEQTKAPKTRIAPNFIENALAADYYYEAFKANHKIIWIGPLPQLSFFTKTKKAIEYPMALLKFYNKTDSFEIKLEAALGKWLSQLLAKCALNQDKIQTIQSVKDDFEQAGFDDFELFLFNKPVNTLLGNGLLIV